ncbi:MAG: hypothetical protein JSR50_03535 [Proteobacteria bacterium]|nr:hypothetical protein [Pseudomonadota bacterium]
MSNERAMRSVRSLVVNAFLFLLALAMPASVLAQACPSGTTSYYLGSDSPSGYTYTNTLAWTGGSLGPRTFTFPDGFTVTLQFTGTNYIDTTQGTAYPSMQNLAGRSSLEVDHNNAPANADMSTLNVTTNAATLSNSFVVEDIDYNAGQYRDKFTASSGATWTPVNSGSYTVTGTSLSANNGTSCSGTAACNATVSWAGGTAHSVVYQNGLGSRSGLQAASYNAFQFCRPRLTMRKQWSGARVNDSATLTAKVSGTTIDSLPSTATATNTLTTDATPTTVSPGDAIAIAETFATGNAGIYSQALVCTGSSGLSGQTLTVGAADTAIVCTYTNTRKLVADLSITKTNGVTSFVSGSTTTYTIRVTNNTGADTATGAVLSDPAVTGLTKTAIACSATPGQCTGGTTPSITQLQAGYALPALAAGQFYEITVTCTVN